MVAFIFALPCDYFFVAFCGIDYTASGKGKDSVAACFILAGTGSEPLKYRIEKADKKPFFSGNSPYFAPKASMPTFLRSPIIVLAISSAKIFSGNRTKKKPLLKKWF